MSAFTEANRKAFDDLSATYNTKQWQLDLANQVAEALQARKDWLGAQWASPAPTPKPNDASNDNNPSQRPPREDIRLLDYACGTGAITKTLGPWVTTIRGIDLSPNMVAAFNAAARSSGLSEAQAHAEVGDLCGAAPTAGLEGPEWHEFDIAAVGLGFHHFEDPARALRRLAERLKARTGVLLLVDFLPFDTARDAEGVAGTGEFPEMKHTIKHNGFTPEALRDMFQAAGFEDFDIVALKKPAVMELASGTVSRTLFVAKGRKSATVLQKLGGWIGSMQDWAAKGMEVDRKDQRKWEPGFAKEGRPVWPVGKQKEEGYDGFQPKGQGSKGWNGL